MAKPKEFYYYLLAYTLVEIRAAETPEEQARIRGLADMVHNIPEALALPWTEERDARIWAQVEDKAQVYGLEEKLQRWERGIMRRIEANPVGQA
jgi:hypothetical protein